MFPGSYALLLELETESGISKCKRLYRLRIWTTLPDTHVGSFDNISSQSLCVCPLVPQPPARKAKQLLFVFFLLLYMSWGAKNMACATEALVTDRWPHLLYFFTFMITYFLTHQTKKSKGIYFKKKWREARIRWTKAHRICYLSTRLLRKCNKETEENGERSLNRKMWSLGWRCSSTGRIFI